MRLVLVLLVPGLLGAQLIPAGQPVPKGPNPPVVFVNGYQSGCSSVSDFASNFGAADKLLQNNSLVTLYFDNCTAPGGTIEALGAAFGKYLAALKYTDGTPVTQVDVVAHSMGGLIVRCYLSGKQDAPAASFQPPATVGIRRAVFLGTPHFGSLIAGLLGPPGDKQTMEMALGSQFLFDLNSWNQGFDDLRGIPAITVTGNAGGAETGIPAFDDGVVALTSSSLSFYRPGVTRVVPYCHTANSLLTLFGYCKPGAPTLNILSTDPGNLVGQALVSFLTGTSAWQQVGESAEANTLLSTNSGSIMQLRDKTDQVTQLIGGSVTSQTPAVILKANPASGLVYSEALKANTALDLSLTPLSGSVQTASLKLDKGTAPVIVKPGPVISPRGVIPAAGPAPFPYDVAPGEYVSIYGTGLASATQSAQVPYPAQINDVQVLVNNVPAELVFVSAGQINFVYPSVPSGLTQLTVRNMNGQHTVSVRVAPAVPAIFLLDANSTAAAVNVTTLTVVGPTSPLHATDFASLYLTGLGATMLLNGVAYARVLPTLTLGGQNVPVLFAGRTPGLDGLDQINFQVPPGITGSAVPIVVTTAGRTSNVAYVAIQ